MLEFHYGYINPYDLQLVKSFNYTNVFPFLKEERHIVSLPQYYLSHENK